MSQFYPSGASSAVNVVSIDGMTEEQVTTFVAARNEKIKAEKEAARKTKATEVGTKIGASLASAGKATGTAVKTTGTVGAKVGKTVWNGAFNLLKASLTVVQDAPATAANAVTLASHAVAAEYKKS